MVIDMNEVKLATLDQVRAFLAGTIAVEFGASDRCDDRYGHIAEVLGRFGYRRLNKPDKGVVLRYLQRTTGYSRQQLTRLVKRRLAGKILTKAYRTPTNGLKRKFTETDLALLAETDSLHGTLSGPATRHLMSRALAVFGDTRYERLATISVGHLYNLRKKSGYIDRRRTFSKTRPTGITIGTRRAPLPDGRPGFIRIDSVHQGDQDGIKGVNHINAVDCVTQWELIATCQKISEAYLLPVIEALLGGFPFGILGFHADNGSEYINHKVARMLDKLAAEFTKSRPRHSNDNGLAETKNGAVIRKHLGYAHIPQHCAAAVNAWCAEHLNPYVNFHRPCLFAEEITDNKGKRRKRYPLALVMTPFEKLASLANMAAFLRPGVTIESLRANATALSDNQAAEQMNQARQKLFLLINKRSRTAA
ncbi:MAG: integrase [Sterolibacteriaceae bacterium]|nr:integrase [Sterolibacteriaceae bacterium]